MRCDIFFTSFDRVFKVIPFIKSSESQELICQHRDWICALFRDRIPRGQCRGRVPCYVRTRVKSDKALNN